MSTPAVNQNQFKQCRVGGVTQDSAGLSSIKIQLQVGSELDMAGECKLGSWSTRRTRLAEIQQVQRRQCVTTM